MERRSRSSVVSRGRNVRPSARSAGVSRGRFLRTAGVGAAAVGIMAAGLGKVAHAIPTMPPIIDPPAVPNLDYITELGNGGYVIRPSNDPNRTTDYHNIKWAMEQVGQNAPGAEIKLTEGRFYVHTSIGIVGFKGTLKGAGKNRTIIEACKSGDGTPFGFTTINLLNSPLPFLFALRGFDFVELKDLTLKTTAGITYPYQTPFFYYLDAQGSRVYEYKSSVMALFVNMPYSEPSDFVAKNVRFQGGPAVPDTSYPGGNPETNPDPALWGKAVGYGVIMPRFNSDSPSQASVTNCEFIDIGWGGFEYFRPGFAPPPYKNGHFLLKNNLFKNVRWPIWQWNLDPTTTIFSMNNTFDGYETGYVYRTNESNPALYSDPTIIEKNNVYINDVDWVEEYPESSETE